MAIRVAVSNTFGSIKKTWKKCEYLRLLVYIIATSTLLYWQYIFGDIVFAFSDVQSDTHHSYIPIYSFFSSAIKDGTLSSYTFQNGFGISIFGVISVVADPFSMIGVLTGVLFGTEYIAESMVYIIILKHICAGFLCLYFLKCFNFTGTSSMISAYLYAFSGYISTIGEHYFFAIKPVYLMLLLIVLEKMIKGKQKVRFWCALLYVSTMVSLSGVIGAYEMFLAAGLYTLFRVIYIYGKDIKYILLRLGVCLAFVVGGILVAAFMLFPVMEITAGSGRLDHTQNVFSFFDFNSIKTGILKLFSNSLEGYINEWYGDGYMQDIFPCFYSVMLVPLAAQFVWQTFKSEYSFREKIFRMIPFVVILSAVFNRFISLLFSFFVYHYQCYAFVFLPIFAVMFADVLDKIKKGKFSRLTNYLTLVVSLVIIILGGLLTNGKGSKISMITMMLSGVMLIFGSFAVDLLYLSSNKLLGNINHTVFKTSSIALVTVIVMNAICENYIVYNYGRTPVTKEVEHTDMLTRDIVDEVNKNESDNFFRFETNYYEGVMFGYLYPLLFPIRATSTYNTVVDDETLEYYNKMFAAQPFFLSKYQECCTTVNNTITEDVLGIKYLLLNNNFARNGWEKVEEYPEQGIALYKNTGLESAGLLFDNYVTQQEADEMTFNERAAGIPTQLILDNPPENIDDFASRSSDNSSYVSNKLDNTNVVDETSIITYFSNVESVSHLGETVKVTANFEQEDSNVALPLKTDIMGKVENYAQLSFTTSDSSKIKKFVYFDSDGVWKDIRYSVTNKTDGKTDYSFIVPKTASHIAMIAKKQGRIDFSVNSEILYADEFAFDLYNLNTYLGNIEDEYLTDNAVKVLAHFDKEGSNIGVPLKTDIVNDSKKCVQISFFTKNGELVEKFVYYDSDGAWKDISQVEPEAIDDKSRYTFVIPQTASALALIASKEGNIDVEISSKIINASYSNQGIHLDNPKRGNIISGIVEAEKNSLLYLPVLYYKGWNAYIDGEMVDIMKANYAFMALPVTAGQHRIDLIYSNQTYHKCLKISVVAFIIYNGFFVACAVVKYKRKRKNWIEEKE